MKKFLSAFFAVCMLLSFIITSYAAENEALKTGEEKRVSYKGETLMFSYTCLEDEDLTVFSSECTAGADLSVTVYNSDLEYIGSDDDSSEKGNFAFSWHAEGAVTYFIEIGEYNGRSCDFTLSLSKNDVSAIEIVSYPEKAEIDKSGALIVNYSEVKALITYNGGNRRLISFPDIGNIYVGSFLAKASVAPISESEAYLTVSYKGKSAERNIIISRVPDKETVSLELVSPPYKSVYRQDIDSRPFSFYDENTKQVVTFSIYDIDLSGLCISALYEDGTRKEYSYGKDSEFFSNLKITSDDQFSHPYVLGKNTVTLSSGSASVSFEITVEENPYIKCEMISKPSTVYSPLYGAGKTSENGKFFIYDTDLSGLKIRLTKKNGETSEIYFNSLSRKRFRAETAQSESSAWGAGEHNVDVYYGSMYAGSYVFTVGSAYIESVSVSTPPALARYYEEDGSEEFEPKGMVLDVAMSDGSSVSVPYSDIENSTGLGAYFKCFSEYEPLSGDIVWVALHVPSGKYASFQFEKAAGRVCSVEISAPPKKLVSIKDFSDYTDITGCKVKVTFSDGSEKEYTFKDKLLPCGKVIFEGAVLRMSLENGKLCAEYRGKKAELLIENVCSVSDFSIGVIDRNMTLEPSLSSDGFCVYKFTPWESGRYDFKAVTEEYVFAGIYDKDGCIVENSVFCENILNGEPGACFSLNCNWDETFYIVLCGLPKLMSEQGKITFTAKYFLPGDANDDGDLTTADILTIRKFLAGLIPENKINPELADINGDGFVSTKDIILLRKFLAGLYLPETYSKG